MTAEHTPSVEVDTTPIELAALLRDPIFYAVGVPLGDRQHTVLLIPDKGHTNESLRALYGWLVRMHYSPYVLPQFEEDPFTDTPEDKEEGTAVLKKVERNVTIIGYRRGGMLGQEITRNFGPRLSVGQVITLGSPSIESNLAARQRIPGVLSTRIYSDTDIRPSPVLEPYSDQKIMVRGSQPGLLVNVNAYRSIESLLRGLPVPPPLQAA